MKARSSKALTVSPVTTPRSTPEFSPVGTGHRGSEQTLIAEARRPTTPVSHQCPPSVVAIAKAVCESSEERGHLLEMICAKPQPWPDSLRHLARRLCDSHKEGQGSDRDHLEPLYAKVTLHLQTLDELDITALRADLTFEPPATRLDPDDAHASTCGLLHLMSRQSAHQMDPAFAAWGDQELADAKSRYNQLLHKMH